MSQSLLCLTILGGCATVVSPNPSVGRARYLMGTTCEIDVPVSAAASSWIETGFAEIARVEALVSTWNENSELSRLNRASVGQARAVSPELARLLGRALSWHQRTNGAFNPLIRPLIDAWRTRAEGALPASDLVSRALSRMRVDQIEIDPVRGTVTRLADVQFEEGGFAKGYAIDRALDVMKRNGAPFAVIDFGGQIGLYGLEEGLEVAIAHPERRDEPSVLLRLRSGSLSTSSGSERTFRIGSTIFSHLIDPRTGRALPPRGSVSVIAESAFVADILSTALYVLGPDEGLVLAEHEGIAAIFLVPSNDGTVYELRRSVAASGLTLRLATPDINIIK